MPITFKDTEGNPLVKGAFYYDLNNCNSERLLYDSPIYQLLECLHLARHEGVKLKFYKPVMDLFLLNGVLMVKLMQCLPKIILV